MRPTLEKSWSSCKSVIIRSSGVFPDGPELRDSMCFTSKHNDHRLSKTVDSWCKPPGAEDASCEAALKAYFSLQTAALISLLHSNLDGLSDDEAAHRLKVAGPNILTSKKPPTNCSFFFRRCTIPSTIC
jgi:hypothetical protein